MADHNINNPTVPHPFFVFAEPGKPSQLHIAADSLNTWAAGVTTVLSVHNANLTKMAPVLEAMNWIATNRPQAIEDYKTATAVTERITNAQIIKSQT